MASEPAAQTCWPAPWLAAALLAAALASPAAAHAQDAGASAPAHEAADPAAAPALPEKLKTLSAQQRLPENLQGWMRERNRLHSAFVERSAAAPEPSAPSSPVEEENVRRKASAEEYKRRLQSFDV